MSDDTQQDEEVSLWDCLHDGTLESVVSDAMARSFLLIIDVPYIWNFHGMPDTTRFHIELDGVRRLTALKFHPWPGWPTDLQNIPYEDSQELWKKSVANSRYESIDWETHEKKMQSSESIEISNATLTFLKNGVTVSLDLSDTDREEYSTLEVMAKNIQFRTDSNQDMTLQDFLLLGETYWKAFSERGSIAGLIKSETEVL